jgi:hypothetical protein
MNAARTLTMALYYGCRYATPNGSERALTRPILVSIESIGVTTSFPTLGFCFATVTLIMKSMDFIVLESQPIITSQSSEKNTGGHGRLFPSTTIAVAPVVLATPIIIFKG